MTMVTRQHVAEWARRAKGRMGRQDTYWELIVNLYDVRFEYDIIAIEGETACIHWQNWFRGSPEGKLDHVDGVFIIIFNTAGSCEQFSQWWFMEK